MTRLLVAARFAWDEYPGLRAGRLYRGAPDLGRSPLGETHVVEGPDAVATLCGLARTAFPHHFPEPARLGSADLCATCRAAGAP